MLSRLKNTSGFTLVEMVIAMTIFAVMSTAIISIYLQSTMMSARLKSTRYLTETAREITQRISEDIQNYGISGKTLDSNYSYPKWNDQDYDGEGSELLVVGSGENSKAYVYGYKEGSIFFPCVDTVDKKAKTSSEIHCGLYTTKAINRSADTITFSAGDSYNLVDSFIPDDEKKRVKIKNLSFYISGDGEKTERKVTLVFTLALMPRIGVPGLKPEESTFHLQTTITDRPYKKN